MPPARRRPELLEQPDGDMIPGPSPEEMDAMSSVDEAAGQVEDALQFDLPLVYDGDIAGTSMTLAVLLPGDNRESYFRAHFTSRKQPHEDDDEFSGRIISVTRGMVLGQLDDAIDALPEFQAQVAARLAGD